MSTREQMAEAAREAIEIAGGQTELARQLSALLDDEISQWRVQKWTYNGVPPQFAIPVEQITNYPRHKLRPDLYPDEAAA